MKLKFLLLCLASIAAAAWATEGSNFGADRHVAKGVVCSSCHGPDLKNPVYPEEATCTACHQKDALIEKTKGLEPNPHNAPHNGDCTLCHMQHEAPVNYCAQCHTFKFQVR